MKKSLEIFLLSLILALAILLRLYKIDNPIADWHSFRQADTASVTAEFVKHGVNFLVPTYHDLSNIQSGVDNPHGFRMVEAPIFNLLHLGVYTITPSLGLDLSGRLTSVILSLISILLLFLIARRLFDNKIALYSAFFISVLPFSVYYSRTVLPESLLISALLLSFYLLLISGGRKSLICLSALSLAISVLTKPYALFFILPHLLYFLSQLRTKKISLLWPAVYFLLALLPFVYWRYHLTLYPAGIPASDWLYNKDGIRFRPAWFRWLFGERIGQLILGIYLTPFFFLGLSKKLTANFLYVLLWGAGILLYFSVIAGGNVQHDYYQAVTVPFICLLLGLGLNQFFTSKTKILVSSVAIITALGLSAYTIKGWYQINNYAIVEAGLAADRLLPEDAKVIAPYNGDTAFLYQTRRTGWPIGYYIDDKIAKGAQYYVSVNFDDETNSLMKKYPVIEKNDQFVIVKLQ